MTGHPDFAASARVIRYTRPETGEGASGLEAMDLRDYIRTIPNYPRTGIMFRDITTLLKHAEALGHAVRAMTTPYRDRSFTLVAGIEARGFILGGAVASALGLGFVPVRKAGKLPHETIGEEYELEYGADRLEIHKDGVHPGDRVLLVDDLIATGGTAEAAVRLIRRAGGMVEAASFVIELRDLGGRARLEKLGLDVLSLCDYAGE